MGSDKHERSLIYEMFGSGGAAPRLKGGIHGNSLMWVFTASVCSEAQNSLYGAGPNCAADLLVPLDSTARAEQT